MFLYTLALEDQCWYVGTSHNPKNRAYKHLNGTGAAWTRLHKPLVPLKDNLVITDLGNVTISEAELEEDIVTERLQRKHGLNKVRGGYTIQCRNMKKRPPRSKARWMYFRYKDCWSTMSENAT